MLGVLMVLFTFLFGGLLLIIALGASRVHDEVERRANPETDVRTRAAAIPGFFLSAQPRETCAVPLDEAFVGQLQRYLDAEQVLAAEFVSRPSLESLYRETGRPLMQ